MKKADLLFITTALCISFGSMAQNVVTPCPQVLIDQKYDHIVSPEYQQQGWDTVVTCQNQEITLSAEPYIPVKFFNGTYAVEEIPYNPADTSFSLGTRMPIGTDDVFANTHTPIPFPFYFFGIRKDQFNIGANGLVTFCSPTDFGSGNYCPYGFRSQNQIPWDGTENHIDPFQSYSARMRDAIYGVMQDIHPGHFVGSETNRVDGIFYGIQDEYPCRKIVCSFKEAPNYGDVSDKSTYQIVCYEGTNIIEVHVKQRRCCPTTSDALIGIQNATGLPQQPGAVGEPNHYVQNGSPAAFWPDGYNVFTSEIDSMAFRFTPQGNTIYSCMWYRIFDDGRDSVTLTTNTNDTNGYYIPMGVDTDHPTLTQAVVRPNTPSRYVLQLSFQNADNDWYRLYDTITVGVEATPILMHDSSIIAEVHDTTYIELPSTGAETTGYEIHDTTYVVVYDTLAVTDTTVLAGCDTIVSHGMIVIHDTIYTVLGGIEGIDGADVRIFRRNGQLVVEGADGSTIALYDAAGRVLATKQSGNQTTIFDIPASGVYLIKIGTVPARRIMVVK